MKQISAYFKVMVFALVSCMCILYTGTADIFAETESDVQETEIAEVEEVEASLIQEGEINEEQFEYVMTERQLYNAGMTDIVNARKAVYEGIANYQERINLSAYSSLSSEDCEEIYEYVVNSNPELFYVDEAYYIVTNGKGEIVGLDVEYKYSIDEIEKRKVVFNQEADKILAGIKSEWTDLEKVLYVHDYFCTHYEYDLTYSNYDASNIFVDKTATCNGYYLAFRYIMNQLGIESDAAASSAMVHIWNQVKINGQWYNIDVTWGDPTKDIIGRATHQNFMKSDDAFLTKYGHHDWTSSHDCTSTSYDNAFWNNVSSSFAYLNGTWYCIYDSSLYSCDINNVKTGSKIDSVGSWSAGGNYYYVTPYAGTGAYGDKIYYNTSSVIKSYAPSTGTIDEVMQGTGAIYGIYLDDYIIHYGYGTTPNQKIAESGTIELQPANVDLTGTLTVDGSTAALSKSIGDKITLTAAGNGGSGSYTYKFAVLNADNGKWSVLTDFNTASTYTYALNYPGNKEFSVSVKDGTGKTVATNRIKVSVASGLSGMLTVGGSTAALTKNVGDKIVLTAAGAGGSGSYTYKFAVLNADTNKWSILRDFSSTSTYTYALNYAGNKEFAVTVKDGTGKTVATNRIKVSVVTFSGKLTVNNSTANLTKKKGDKITLNASATGGSGSYTYKFVVLNADTGKWSILRDFNAQTSYTYALNYTGIKEFAVSVKDSTGKIVATNRIRVNVTN